MKKILPILLILTFTAVAIADGEQSRVMQIMSVGKEIKATDEQVASAIASGCTVEEFVASIMGKIRLVAVDAAPTGSPVQIAVEGMPEKAAEVWRRHPTYPTDVWLELFDRKGTRVNIFWSSVPGSRRFELIVAENGPDVPVLEIASHVLQYGEDPGPDPDPHPVPIIPEPETPSAELQKLVRPLVIYAGDRILDAGDLINLTEFYFDFAGTVRRDNATIINNTATFRTVYMEAGALMFQQTGMKGKYAGLAEIVDGIISDYIGLDVVRLDATKTSDVLNAVAWAFYQEVE